jgi:GNAT superfamily N-acetyltransferase
MNTESVTLVPFQPEWAQKYSEMLAEMTPHDLQMTGSEPMSPSDVMSCFTAQPNRFDLLMVSADESALVGDVNVFFPVETREEGGDNEEHKPQVNIYVAPSWRGRGLALAALESARAVVEQRGYGEWYAIIDDRNCDAQCLFQDKMGFEMVKEMPEFGQSVYKGIIK